MPAISAPLPAEVAALGLTTGVVAGEEAIAEVEAAAAKVGEASKARTLEGDEELTTAASRS